MKTTRLRPSYKLGIYYTDIWSLDISNLVEPFTPEVVPPVPCVFTQRVVTGPSPGYDTDFGSISYLAFPYYPNLIEDFGYSTAGLLKYGPRLMITFGLDDFSSAFFRFVGIMTVRPIFGVIYEGKEINRLTHPDDFRDDHPSGYSLLKTYPGGDTEHPFYDLVRNPPAVGSTLEFQFILL